MDVKVHEDYEQIDKENVEIFRKYRIGKSEEDMYRCVICGEKACISNSLSRMGHRLMHTQCMERTFGYDKVIDAFRWMEEQDK